MMNPSTIKLCHGDTERLVTKISICDNALFYCVRDSIILTIYAVHLCGTVKLAHLKYKMMGVSVCHSYCL